MLCPRPTYHKSDCRVKVLYVYIVNKQKNKHTEREKSSMHHVTTFALEDTSPTNVTYISRARLNATTAARTVIAQNP